MFLAWLKTISLMIVCGFLTLVLWDVHGLIRDARVTLRLADPVMGNLNDSAFQISAMTKTASGALQAETKRLDASTRELQKTEASARLLIVRTNRSLNTELFPMVAQVVKDQNATLLVTQKQLQSNLLEMQKATAQLQVVIADMGVQIANPAIKESVDNLALITQDAADGMKQLAGIATDGRQVADKARETYMKPVNLWWALAKQLVSTGGSVAQMVK